MSSSKTQRHYAIAEIIRTGGIANQEELADRLAALGYAVTQATISRDLEQLGAVKVRRAGQLIYSLPDRAREATGTRLGAVIREWVRTIDTAANLVVIKTPPGSAHLVGVVLDQSEIAEIVGTICGDDTIFVACRESKTAKVVATNLRAASANQ